MPTELKLPDLGENIKSGDVVKLLVNVGDVIKMDQPLMELETDKAVIEVPSSLAGTVKQILVKPGDKVAPGQAVMLIEEGATKAETKAEEKPVAKTDAPTPEKVEKKPEPAKVETAIVAEKTTTTSPLTNGHSAGQTAYVAAAPSVRKFARELGVNIGQVEGSGPRNRISIEDVKLFVKSQMTSGGGRIAQQPLPDFSKWGEISREAMSNVRRSTAEKLSRDWATGPQVTHFDKCDITKLEALRKKHGPKVEAAGGKLTMTAVLIKVCTAALKTFPQFAASIDMQNQEIIFKKYINIGVAVDTERGLLVPVLHNTNKKNITQLSVELGELGQKARDRKLKIEEMQGSVFTISNLGGIGGVGFTPIVNQPDVAILGVSRASMEPVWNGKEFQPKLIMPLSLSYDHRLIDGADAARFLRWVCEALEEPFLLSLEG